MKLLQMTDIHLTTPGNTIAGRDPNDNFDRALSHALAAHGDADAIFITGDLSDWGERADYERLRERLSMVPIPVHLCIGNHDDRPTFADVMPACAGAGGFVQKAIDLPLGRALTIDTWGPETHAGHFCEARADWLDQELSAFDGPFWLFMHHNPVPTHIGSMDQIMLLDHVRFANAIRPHAHKIRHIFHGHCHLPLCGSLLGIPLSAPRGTNHQGWADFAAKDMLSGSDLPQAYAVIFAEEDSTLVHMVEFGYDGPIHAEASPDYATWDKATMAR